MQRWADVEVARALRAAGAGYKEGGGGEGEYKEGGVA